MGLFNRSKAAESPQPNLSIHLSHHQEQILEPDSAVAGQVSLTTPFPISPQAIEISFWGESAVWIRLSHSHSDKSTDYTHYRDKAPLFNLTSNILHQNKTQILPGQTYTFPFSFRFPLGTGNNRTGCYKDPNDERWTVLPHPLPPTFFSGNRWCREGDRAPDYAEISYGITARLLCPGVGVGKYHEEPISATTQVNFQPANPHLQSAGGPGTVVRHTKPFTLQSSSLTGLNPSAIGLRKRIHDRFSSATPRVEFELALEMPDFLTSGAEFRFRAQFTVLQTAENVIRVPPILFKVEKLELLDFTFFRAKRDWSANSCASGNPLPKYYEPKEGSKRADLEWDMYRELKTALNAQPSEQMLELAEVPLANDKKGMGQARDCEAWFSARVPGFTPPSFKSFAITRAYRLKTKLAVQVGEKAFDMVVESFVRELGSGRGGG